jgi:glycosyltransferase involved in cell wall biosynthesis
VLTPHAPALPASWSEEGVEVRSFRYAPEPWELLGYGRSLASDERPRAGAAAVTPLYLAGLALAARRLMRTRRFDLVHAHWIVPNGVGALLLDAATPLAIGVHGSDVFMAEKSGVRSLSGAALRRARLVTGCSPELVERVCALGFPESAARVIPYGVDTETFAPGEDRVGWRQRLGIPAAATVLLTVGRMVSKKGFDVLVEALPNVLAAAPSLHVVFAGDGDRREEWRAGTEALGDRVHFPGAVLRDALPDLYRAADLFVLPAVHDRAGNVDGLPNVILEAMASGLPVVASRISGIPLAVESGRQGLLVAERHVADLAESLARLAGDPQRLAAMGKAARHRARTELTWDAVAGRYREAYLSVLGARS